MNSAWIDIHTHHPTTATTITTVGVHPWQAATGVIPDEKEIAATDAIGEIGLDKACGIDMQLQKACFDRQLQLAERHKKAVVLHVVKAFEEVMQSLEDVSLKAVIFHGFIGSKEQAERAVKRGYYLSFGARSAGSRKTIGALRTTPLERLFVESDETTIPLAELYETIAGLRGVTTEVLQQATRENYKRIFGEK